MEVVPSGKLKSLAAACHHSTQLLGTAHSSPVHRPQPAVALLCSCVSCFVLLQLLACAFGGLAFAAFALAFVALAGFVATAPAFPLSLHGR